MSIAELNFLGRRKLPVIRAAEAAECGLVCMAMIGRYYGHDIDLNGLRQRHSVSLTGATLKDLMQLADDLTLASRPLRVGIKALKRINLPAVVHWDMNHFVVLKSVKGDTYTIHDPAMGKRVMNIQEFSNHYTGIALELAPTGNFEKLSARIPVRLNSMWSGMHGMTPSVTQVLIVSLLIQIATFAMPFHIQLVVDEAIGRADRNLLPVLALGFGALTLMHAGLTALRSWILRLLGSMLSFQVVGNIVRHLVRLPVSFFEKRHVGDIISRIESTEAIQDALTRGMISALVDGLMAIVAAFILFLYSPMLAMVVIASLALVMGLGFLYFPITRAATEDNIVAKAGEQSHLIETLRAMPTVKLMGGEIERETKWRNRYASVINSSVRVGKLEITREFLQTSIIGIQTILVVYLGARMVLNADGFSVGMLMAFMSFRQTFSDRTLSVAEELINFRLLRLHLDRLGDIVTAETDMVIGQTHARHDVKGEISLQNVSFRYGDNLPLVLENISMHIQPGEFLAISGHSGGGKTTLAKLLLGLNQPTSGTIHLDGLPATPALWREWRSQIGVVAQDDQLISGSIADNIAFFDPDLDMERVLAAAEAARVHQDIIRMPMQYLSLVGDMGSALSGGQRQRILLARALYRQPKLLLLDEGTANLDEQTEREIVDLIQSMPITRIAIAHRPALIMAATRHLIVDEGRIYDADAYRPMVQPAMSSKASA